MNRWQLVVAGLAGVGLVVIVVMLLLPKPPVPGPVKAQLTSTLLVPEGRGAAVDRQTVKYDRGLKLLSYTVKVQGAEVVVSEEPTPDSFTDVPQVYDKVVESMGEYGQFDVDVGTVHLTHPKDLGGKQAAVLNTKGTLLFAKAASLSEDQWRQFFTSMRVER